MRSYFRLILKESQKSVRAIVQHSYLHRNNILESSENDESITVIPVLLCCMKVVFLGLFFPLRIELLMDFN